MDLAGYTHFPSTIHWKRLMKAQNRRLIPPSWLADACQSREPWIACQEFPATNCVDAEIILPKWLTF